MNITIVIALNLVAMYQRICHRDGDAHQSGRQVQFVWNIRAGFIRIEK